ncbi:MAG: hypothetical protein M3Q03_01075, partial [Chloroflexota bacterium]|nr:hypothetical protein [Chloroflexota bacterium]
HAGEPVAPPAAVAPAGTEQVLGPGDVVAFPTGTATLSLRNAASAPVVVVAVAWLPSAMSPDVERASVQPGTGMPPTTALTGMGTLAEAMLSPMDPGQTLSHPGITVVPLGRLESLGAAQVPPGRVVVTLERVLLAPGTSLPPLPAAGPVLLTVEEGSLGLIPAREPAWVRFPTARQEAVSTGSETRLTEGDAAFWDAEAAVLLRGGYDTTGSALLLAISSADQEGENGG